MAERSVGDVFVNFEGKLDGIKRDTKKAENIVSRSAEKMRQLSNVRLFGGAETILKAVSAIGTAELAISALNVGTLAMKGDFEGAAAAAERIPLGIGAAVGQLRQFLGEITGINDEIREIEQRTARMEKQQAAFREQAKRQDRQDAIDAAFQDTLSLSERVDIAGAPQGFLRQRASLIFQRNTALSKIEEQFSRTNTSLEKNIQAREQRRELTFALFDNKLNDLRNQFRRDAEGGGQSGGFDPINQTAGGFVRSQAFSFQRTVFGTPTRPLVIEGKQLEEINATTKTLLDSAQSILNAFTGGGTPAGSFG